MRSRLGRTWLTPGKHLVRADRARGGRCPAKMQVNRADSRFAAKAASAGLGISCSGMSERRQRGCDEQLLCRMPTTPVRAWAGLVVGIGDSLIALAQVLARMWRSFLGVRRNGLWSKAQGAGLRRSCCDEATDGRAGKRPGVVTNGPKRNPHGFARHLRPRASTTFLFSVEPLRRRFGVTPADAMAADGNGPPLTNVLPLRRFASGLRPKEADSGEFRLPLHVYLLSQNLCPLH